MKDENKNIIIGILIVLLIMVLSFTVYLLFFKIEKNKKVEIPNPEIRHVDTFEKIIGIYENNDNQRISFTINSEGIGEYVIKDICGNEYCILNSVTGKVSIGKNMVYLLNNNCEKEINDNGDCEYPNCKPIYEFEYHDDTMTIDGFTLSKR